MKRNTLFVLATVMLVCIIGCPQPQPQSTYYDLNFQIQGSGSVTTNPEGTSFLNGTQVALQPVPAGGWHFSHWGGNLSGQNNPAVITMSANRNVTAVFEINDSGSEGEGEGEGELQSATASISKFGQQLVVTLNGADDPASTLFAGISDWSQVQSFKAVNKSRQELASATFDQQWPAVLLFGAVSFRIEAVDSYGGSHRWSIQPSTKADGDGWIVTFNGVQLQVDENGFITLPSGGEGEGEGEGEGFTSVIDLSADFGNPHVTTTLHLDSQSFMDGNGVGLDPADVKEIWLEYYYSFYGLGGPPWIDQESIILDPQQDSTNEACLLKARQPEARFNIFATDTVDVYDENDQFSAVKYYGNGNNGRWQSNSAEWIIDDPNTGAGSWHFALQNIAAAADIYGSDDEGFTAELNIGTQRPIDVFGAEGGVTPVDWTGVSSIGIEYPDLSNDLYMFVGNGSDCFPVQIPLANWPGGDPQFKVVAFTQFGERLEGIVAKSILLMRR